MISSVHRLMAAALVFAIQFATPADGVAESALEHVPADALGITVVRNIGAANVKVEKFLKIFEGLSESPPPPPLEFIKGATGLGAGINEAGDVLIAALPGDSTDDEPRLLLAAPISDYSQFAASVNGDASGEICRVTIAGEEVLVAKKGAFALLMNLEHRPVLERLVAGEDAKPASLAPLADWIDKNDAVAILLPAGVKMSVDQGRKELAAEKANTVAGNENAPDREIQRNAADVLDFYDSFLGALGTEAEVAAFGLSIDDQTNVLVSGRVVLGKTGKLANLPESAPRTASHFLGHAAGPLVFAIGGSFPEGTELWLPKLSHYVMKEFRGLYGFEKFEGSHWDQVEESMRDSIKGLRHLSTILRPGTEDDPLFSNVFTLLETTGSADYLSTIRKSYEVWNSLMSNSTSDLAKMQYEIEDEEIDGKKGLVISADITSLMDQQAAPVVLPIMKKAFGEEGKTRTHYVAVTDKLVVTGLAPTDKLKPIMEQAVAGEAGLADMAETKSTVKLLDESSSWQALISPSGCVEWIKRIVKVFVGPQGMGMPPIPDYPTTPPVGFSFKLGGGQMRIEMAWPVDTLTGLASFIKAVEKAF